jgi:hypothetical protein
LHGLTTITGKRFEKKITIISRYCRVLVNGGVAGIEPGTIDRLSVTGLMRTRYKGVFEEEGKGGIRPPPIWLVFNFEYNTLIYLKNL